MGLVSRKDIAWMSSRPKAWINSSSMTLGIGDTIPTQSPFKRAFLKNQSSINSRPVFTWATADSWLP
jgi:hypothetical protein